MKRNEALKLLKIHKATLADQFDVTRLALFGSTARDTAEPDSDIDTCQVISGQLSPRVRSE